MIKPTVGRVVWLYPPGSEKVIRIDGEPLAAIIARVHSDKEIAVGYLDATGRSGNKANVLLIQEGEDPPKDKWYATWMPYQVGQAKAQAASAA